LPWLWFDRIENQINRTDTKAQLVLAVDALPLGWFSTQHPMLRQIKLIPTLIAPNRTTRWHQVQFNLP
jgi:hypothetical protein